MKGIPASFEALWTQRGESGWRYAVKLDERHCNAQGIIHGGLMVSFLDHALSLQIWEATDRSYCTTVQLDTKFLRPVRPPAFIELDSEIIKQGKNLVFARAALMVEGGRVLEASGVWNVTRHVT